VPRAAKPAGADELFFNSPYVIPKRVSSNTSNWIADVTGGGILCSLAIMDDYRDEDLEPYLTGMILKLNELIMEYFDRDGGYGEGFMYLNHAMYCLNAVLPAHDRTYGVRFPQKLYKYLDSVLYVFDPETRITRPSDVLMMRTIVPARYEAGVHKRPLTLYEFRGEDEQWRIKSYFCSYSKVTVTVRLRARPSGRALSKRASCEPTPV